MIIQLYDCLREKDVKVTINIECSTPTNDLFVVFINEKLEIELLNNSGTSEYEEFYFRRVSYIIDATTNYLGDEISLTLGVYFSDNERQFFLIGQSYPNHKYTFESSSIYDENYSNHHLLFNYQEYSELQSIGLEKLSFDEYVKKLIEKKISKEQNILYRIKTNNGKSNSFLSQKGFSIFLEEEEKK